MHALLLLRHAKSSRDDSALDDFDRPLAPRGNRDAPHMGAEIVRRGWRPDLALVSTALRARQTWELASAAFPGLPETRYEQSLYMASARKILALLRTLPEAAATVIVTGHNPGMEELAAMLAGQDSAKKPLKQTIEKFPTAAIARLTFDGPWAELAPGSARLTDFTRPGDRG